MPEAESGQTTGRVLIDAGVFIGALLKGDPRHAEARPLVEQAKTMKGALMSQPTSATIRRPRTDDRPVWDVVLGVYGYPAVLLAHKLKLFPFLAEQPRTLQEVGEALKIERRPAEAILTAATALGFLHLQDGRYALTPLAEDYLLERSPTYFGGYLDLIIATYPVCSLESLESVQEVLELN